MDKSINQLNPNDVIKIGDKWYRIRYLRYWGNEASIDLQKEEDLLSYYHDKTCLRLSINKDSNIKFEVKSETDT
ncbi:hypothetical protein [Shigella sp. FC1655]|uniref:hypothetical protein n=1 Tax=unclassified Shigella TaxID=2629414 RepID=UPI000847D702|nr:MULTISPECIES: hypothetical protein [unclassified Shigella]ODQ06479.1 hypothetical protein BGK50_17635 [Shigella sp. FC130]OEI94016.1 hypothetical protein BHE86_16400 [Shigella sp. FC1655]